MVPPKCEIIMELSNHSFFQYCDSNIGLFLLLLKLSSLLNFFYNFFSCFLYFPFYSYRSSNYRHSNSCRSFSLLKGIAIQKRGKKRNFCSVLCMWLSSFQIISRWENYYNYFHGYFHFL